MLHRPPSPPPDSRWSSIRPHRPRLLLTVLDVDSVSVSFTLTATLDAAFVRLPPDDPSLHRLRTAGPAEAAENTQDEDQDELEKCGISQILRSGMDVKVNGERWEKVIIDTVNDAEGNNQEEGVVTIYGLLPKQTYDIDLVVAATDEVYGGLVTTESEADCMSRTPMRSLPVDPHYSTPATYSPTGGLPRSSTTSPTPDGHSRVNAAAISTSTFSQSIRGFA